jgi:prepilin-type N-terminal cleavage/methylation domain-containing protein
MRTHRHRARRGFSLGELMISMTLIAIIGASLTKLIVTQSKFSNKQVQQRNARSVSRGALAIMESELRAVEQSTAFVNGNALTSFGTVVQRPTAVTLVVNVPWAVGVKCTANRVALLPIDSVSAAIGIASTVGVAWRGADDRYVYDPIPTADNSGNALDFSACTGAGITATGVDAMPNMRMVSLTGTGVPATVIAGTPLMLFYRVKYEFRPSTTVTGRIGLFRSVAASGATFGTAEELIAPFGTTAGFRYFIGTNRTPSFSVPSTLNLETISGVYLDLHGQSETRAQGQTAYESANFETSIFFRNRI